MLDFPPQSPDLNPIEPFWDFIDSKLPKSERTSKDAMWKILLKAWESVDVSDIRKLLIPCRIG